jgi:hypothetical protein
VLLQNICCDADTRVDVADGVGRGVDEPLGVTPMDGDSAEAVTRT